LYKETNVSGIISATIIRETEKVKVKLSLCVTKHNAMSTCGSGGIVPRTPNLGTRWRGDKGYSPNAGFSRPFHMADGAGEDFIKFSRRESYIFRVITNYMCDYINLLV
jgi:hypothetical protein